MNNGWNNHEDTFEEALRRELLQARKENELLKDDLKQLTLSYYKAISKNYESKERLLPHTPVNN